jgi:CRP-like cAMP-binding protein
MNAGQIRDTIRTVLCRGLTVEQADHLVKVLVPAKITAGGPVLREGDSPSGLFLLLSGTVEILKQTPDGASQSLGKVGAPTVLGEMSLITERPHSATVMAVSDCEFYLLTRAQFQRLIASESIAAYKLIATIAQVLAGRVMRLDQKVLELSATRGAAAPVEELAAFKQKLFSEWSF